LIIATPGAIKIRNLNIILHLRLGHVPSIECISLWRIFCEIIPPKATRRCSSWCNVVRGKSKITKADWLCFHVLLFLLFLFFLLPSILLFCLILIIFKIYSWLSLQFLGLLLFFGSRRASIR
jgi:hypothetical protein